MCAVCLQYFTHISAYSSMYTFLEHGSCIIQNMLHGTVQYRLQGVHYKNTYVINSKQTIM